MFILTLYAETTGSSSRSDGTAAFLKQLVFLAAAIFTHRMQLRVKNEGVEEALLIASPVWSVHSFIFSL